MVLFSVFSKLIEQTLHDVNTQESLIKKKTTSTLNPFYLQCIKILQWIVSVVMCEESIILV